MAIEIDRHLDRGVAHLLFDVNRTLAVLGEERSEGVPEIVKAYFSEPGPRQEAVEYTISNVMGMEQASPASLGKTQSGTSRFLSHPLRSVVLGANP